MTMPEIPVREALHFLGWRGTPVEPALMAQIEALIARVREQVQPRAIMRRFVMEDDALRGTTFAPQGADVRAMLAPCGEAVLLAATFFTAGWRWADVALCAFNALIVALAANGSYDAMVSDARRRADGTSG